MNEVWAEREDTLEELETKREYDGYVCSIKDSVVIVILGRLCDLKSMKKIPGRPTSEHIMKRSRYKKIPYYWRYSAFPQ